jgi:hypothetical protein
MVKLLVIVTWLSSIATRWPHTYCTFWWHTIFSVYGTPYYRSLKFELYSFVRMKASTYQESFNVFSVLITRILMILLESLFMTSESFHARSSRGVHPTVSDFNEVWYTVSMDKYNNPCFLFSPYWLSFSFYSPLKITLNVIGTLHVQ